MQPLGYFSQRILMLVNLFPGLLLTVASQSDTASLFWRTHGFLCINSNYTEVYAHIATATCASICMGNQRCQAFTTNDGPCQLFVFDRCSKSVRNCKCTRTGQVFVKQQPGLRAGALCPDGYGDDLCGVKYKGYNDGGNWWTGRQKCESESGLVIMTDVTDERELQHLNVLFNKYSRFFLGAFQPPGSVEPYGGWHWVGCNITFDINYWAGPGEPSTSTNENVVFKGSGPKLGDASITHLNTSMCECLSPFN